LLGGLCTFMSRSLKNLANPVSCIQQNIGDEAFAASISKIIKAEIISITQGNHLLIVI
jgi:hypothetical protein